jgi:hypothetical protein
LKEKHIIDIDEGYEGNGEEDNVWKIFYFN